MSPTPLEHRIKAMIRLGGPLSIADYMAEALGDPEHGYYMAREAIGAAGDFVTAPEVSQMFGELIGLWAVDTWMRLGRPDPFRLVELGPGRGTLMADALRAARIRPDFLGAARLHLVETSPKLRARQRQALAGGPLSPQWHDRVEEIAEGPAVVLANEFFDALPIRQWQRVGGLWRERVVGLDADGELAFGLGAGVLTASEVPGRLAGVPEGAILETGAVAAAMMEHLAERIVRSGGALLAIDYGTAQSGIGDSFQAVRAHQPVDPLDRPGEADLTAHVDFQALATAARRARAAVHGPMEQGDFLLALGLAERAGRLGADQDEAGRARITGEVARLVSAEEMGTLFKVMAVTRPGLVPAPWGA
ncbi:class I SAM-dependent methyltransferase [Prosthecomicrobium sp. N25]|uniref:class I SAM-dependent methyltransferase n=1 Tax=Prosthecomicrobium sp. N25 TaxID=3129254 RepID=UPI0030784019